ncbi:type II toxin-antitoxin system RelE/ParE family toxin [Opacimonas viscosa]|uniref:Type II toxin-antitoxin system RelE/ParE family toxin n=1 Tax=Opacimonas viscosa TaxID=2961944 RepID=A0AA42BM93_9ALTE|nr:type II toxin-antitoxin system RelE/ParE family toxin [Opacimonas viscosa]MCP3429580.1 type II toxin-antitoxin system RelE/ParE family toxin [Opacimonas viscosa]
MKYEIITTEHFDKWLSKLKDKKAVNAISIRLLRAECGNLGDIKSVGSGISEMIIFVGKGYRVYFTIRDGKLIILLHGGHKDSQKADIKLAHAINQQLDCD